VETVKPFLKFDEENFKRSALAFSGIILRFLSSKSGQKMKNGGVPNEEDNRLLKQIYPHSTGGWGLSGYHHLTVKNHRLDRFMSNFMWKLPSVRYSEFAELIGIEINKTIQTKDSDFFYAIERKLKAMLPYEDKTKKTLTCTLYNNSDNGRCGGIH